MAVLRYRFVIFDFDGTLADTLGWAARQMPAIAARYGTRQIDPDEYDHIRTLTPDELLSYLEIPGWKMPLIMWEMRRRMRRETGTGTLTLFPGIAGVLLELANAGVQLAVLSSNAERNIRAVLGPESEPLIGQYLCGVSFFGKKGKLKKLLGRTASDPVDVLFIGDELRDLQAAKAAGVAFGAASWGLNSKETFARHSPFRIFTKPEEISLEVLSG